MTSNFSGKNYAMYLIDKEYQELIKLLVGGTIYGMEVTKDSPIEVLLVAAYNAGFYIKHGPFQKIEKEY